MADVLVRDERELARLDLFGRVAGNLSTRLGDSFGTCGDVLAA